VINGLYRYEKLVVGSKGEYEKLRVVKKETMGEA